MKSRALKAIAIGGGVLGALGIAALVAKRSQEPSSKQLQTPRRVALIGDSYAVGLGPELTKLISDFRYDGVEGTNTAQWAKHSAKCGSCGDWLTAFKPDVALVSLGVNDGSTPNPDNYQEIVRALHGIGARVVWIEPPSSVKTAARSVIASLGVTTIPAMNLAMASDGLHPNNYAPWAQEIAEELRRA